MIPEGKQRAGSAEQPQETAAGSTAKSDVLAPLRSSSEEKEKKRILVVEDNAFVRECLVRYINLQKDIMCCGEADSIASAPGLVAIKTPELVLLDLRLKDGESFGLMELLQMQFPGLLVLVLSQADEAFHAEKALRCGAKGYVMKQKGPAELLQAIRVVLNGGTYVSRALEAQLSKNPTDTGAAPESEPGISPDNNSGARTNNSRPH